MTNAPSHYGTPDAIEEHYDKCLVRTHADIRRHLQRLLDGRCTLRVHAGGHDAGTLTVLLEVGTSSFWIDVPPSRMQLEHWLGSQRLHFEGHVERVAVRFACGTARLDTQEGQPALALPLPDQLLHMQRREFMRREPLGGLRCRIPAGPYVEHPGGLTATIRDIGGGGVALLLHAAASRFQVGDRLSGCVVELPGLEPMSVTLDIRHIVPTTQRGKPMQQLGCEFTDLPAATQTRLLRYIMQLDREQVLRRRGA
ncbi:flagellar brake protein [Lysobacter niastensis]|uniref:Flagellar brake protein n=1 Tax=Lysobacter niastensis TaxID=380629 RepID=A0ABS0BAE6_9GAMM|nr:flagellar brake protein [Lysobacter niastensis]MBF6024619.1 flagellar brake protein [Lysobacter niastensis]